MLALVRRKSHPVTACTPGITLAQTSMVTNDSHEPTRDAVSDTPAGIASTNQHVELTKTTSVSASASQPPFLGPVKNPTTSLWNPMVSHPGHSSTASPSHFGENLPTSYSVNQFSVHAFPTRGPMQPQMENNLVQNYQSEHPPPSGNEYQLQAANGFSAEPYSGNFRWHSLNNKQTIIHSINN